MKPAILLASPRLTQRRHARRNLRALRDLAKTQGERMTPQDQAYLRLAMTLFERDEKVELSS